MIRAGALKNGGFFFAAGRHFLENERGDLSFLSVVLN